MKLFIILGILLNPDLKLHPRDSSIIIHNGTTAKVVDISGWIEDRTWDEKGGCRKAALALNPDGKVLSMTVGPRFFCKSM